MKQPANEIERLRQAISEIERIAQDALDGFDREIIGLRDVIEKCAKTLGQRAAG
jgi:hypothetical protein